MFTQDSRSERRAGGEVVVTAREDRYNHIEAGKYKYSLLPVADCGASFD